MDKLRAELHCHSGYSKDSNLSLEAIIAICEQKGIQVIALTDHNEIAGAVELQKIAPKWLTVIVGEEIATQEGDIIGLFLKERIEPRLPIEETIQKIREQSGAVLLPHPFDRLRKEAVGQAVTERIKDKIDFIEIFNARCVFRSDNTCAETFALANKLSPFVGSDAHQVNEYGNAVCLLDPFATPQAFIHSLKQATFENRYAPLSVHIRTKLTKIQKRGKP